MAEHKDYDGITYRAETRSPLVFRLLFSLLIIWGLGFMGYYLFSGWSSEAEFAENKKAKQTMLAAKPATATTTPAGKEDSIAAGKSLFAARCAACHGANATGGIGPDLTRKEFKFGKDTATITQSIAEGRPGGMPSFKADLSHEKLESLVKFILSL